MTPTSEWNLQQGEHPRVDFLAELRHELRTPLNAILGYSELILEDADAELRARVAGPLGAVIEIARRLLATIDAQMRSYLIETGTISLADLRYAMRTTLDQLRGEAGTVEAALRNGRDSEAQADVDRIVIAASRLSDLIDLGLTSTSVAAGCVAAPGTLETAAPDRSLPSESSPGRILVADDNPENRDLLTRRLRQQGHVAVGAADGQIALDLLDSEPFDLLLLDIMMPRVSGFEVLRVLREKDRLRDLPVIMISALDDIESVVECLKLGAVDHLPKPFNPVVLNARITASLSVKRLRDEARAYHDQIEVELKTARDIQLMMVPAGFAASDHAPSMSVYSSLSPARRIGGDLYDFFYGADRKFYFFIGDVCGKGIPAALYMTRAKTVFRLIAEQAGRGESAADAAAILKRINRELARDNPSLMFVTALLGVLDCTTGATELANAGHPMPIMLRAGELPSTVDVPPGLPLGLAEDHVFHAREIELSPGTTLFLYTDGVTDTMDAQDVQFGDTRLFEALSVLDEPIPKAVVASLTHSLAVHAGATEQFDDITMLALRYMGQPQVQWHPLDQERRRPRLSRDQVFQAMPTPNAVEITIENRTAEIARVLDLIESFADGHGIAPRVATAVAVCVDELLSNMIHYGYPEHGAGRIAVALSVDGGALCARIEDDGTPFDPSRAVPASVCPPRKPSIGGYGLVLVHALIDELSYSSGGASNVTTLKKRIDPPQSTVVGPNGSDPSGDK